MIDFTIMSVFIFVCLSAPIEIGKTKNASIFFNSIFCYRKVKLVGTLRGQKVIKSFQKRQEKQQKMKLKPVFEKINFVVCVTC